MVLMWKMGSEKAVGSGDEEIIGLTGVEVECAENGYEAAAAIRKLPRKDAVGIPIVAMTANAFAEDIMYSKRAGMNEHITKPLDTDQRMKCLENIYV